MLKRILCKSERAMSFIRDISERMPDGWTGLDVLDSWEFPISKRPPIAG